MSVHLPGLWLFEAHAVSVVGYRGWPVREYTQNAHVLCQHVEHDIRVTVVVDHLGHCLVVKAATVLQKTRAL